jgi:hypothetical protein
MRSVYFLERRYSLDDKKSWVFMDSQGRYIIMAPRQEENGLIKVKKIEASELE